MAWESVRANGGSGGIDKISIPAFQAVAEAELERLHEELKQGTYRPMPVRRTRIPKKGKPHHEPLIDMIAEQISDGRILNLVRQMLEAGYMEGGKKYETPSGTPQGSVASPLFSNIYLNRFDHEMTGKGYHLTRFADDWVVLCKTQAETAKTLRDANGAKNVERMKKGNAPQRYNPEKGGMESMELSHEPIPLRDGGTEFVPRWPQDHAKVDSYRRPGY